MGPRFYVNRTLLVLLFFNLFYHQCQTQKLIDDQNISSKSSLNSYSDQPSEISISSDVTSEVNFPSNTLNQATQRNLRKIDQIDTPEQQEVDNAVLFGLEEMYKLYYVEEPKLYKMGLFLENSHPGHKLASFRTHTEKSQDHTRYGYAAVQASSKIVKKYSEIKSRDAPPSITLLRSNILSEKCPLRGTPRCTPSFERYRTADGTCNNLQHPWNGAAMLPMQRLLPPQYDDGVQSIRKSVLGGNLPSAREVSAKIHSDRNREMETLTLMFMQWGQFLGHDIVFSAQARMFNRTVPRCCEKNGRDTLPLKLSHPECLPIEIPENDWFYSKFDIRCMEFVRSAPTSRIDCNLGWREQISQVTAYIDGSMIYGSDTETSDLLRLFKRGQIVYGRPKDEGPLQPPDPPEGELCKLGAITTDCFQSGDFRVSDQPGLTALHTVWIRYHNLIALELGRLNGHWSDEKIYQETRKIVAALIQHITFKEFLPIVLGQEVMELFDLNLLSKGFYNGYNPNVNPAPENAFGGAAFRFGHSLVQHSLIRADSSHNLIRNNVTLHQEQENVENIWSLGSLDRLILGLCNQPSQKRDEFISSELTNHLFQSSRFPFGMDLAAINIQRGRDHGIPSYSSWRQPCGLTQITKWSDLEKLMSLETVNRLKSTYKHFDDIDLFSGGLAEKPVRGGIVGPTFACIIAQQFSNLRQGDRFWYENGNLESSFTPAQLQQMRQVTFAHILCKTLSEIKTLQLFVFLVNDNLRNSRWSCDSLLGSFKLGAWIENLDRQMDLTDKGTTVELTDGTQESRVVQYAMQGRRRRTTTTTRAPPKKIKKPVKQQSNRPFKVKLTNVSTAAVNKNKNKHTRRTTKSPPKAVVEKKPTVNGYLVNMSTNSFPNQAPSTYQTVTIPPNTNPFSLNINIQFVPSNNQDNNQPYDYNYQKPPNIKRPSITVYDQNSQTYDQIYHQSNSNKHNYNSFVTKRPSYPIDYSNYGSYSHPTYGPSTYGTKLGNSHPPYGTKFENFPFATSGRPTYMQSMGSSTRPVIIPSYLFLNDRKPYENFKDLPNPTYEELTDNPDLHKTKKDKPNDNDDTKFVKISSVQGQKFIATKDMREPVLLSIHQREGDLELPTEVETTTKSSLVQVDIIPIRAGEWKIYNETSNKPIPSISDVIDFKTTQCTDEIPHPINDSLVN